MLLLLDKVTWPTIAAGSHYYYLDPSKVRVVVSSINSPMSFLLTALTVICDIPLVVKSPIIISKPSFCINKIEELLLTKSANYAQCQLVTELIVSFM